MIKLQFLSIKKNIIGSESLEYNLINSNIKNLIIDEKFYDTYILSIKDLLVKDNKIYFSFGNQLKECFYFNIFRADLNQNFLEYC